MSLDANIFARMAQEEILPREAARVRKVVQISTNGLSGEGLGVYRLCDDMNHFGSIMAHGRELRIYRRLLICRAV